MDTQASTSIKDLKRADDVQIASENANKNNKNGGNTGPSAAPFPSFLNLISNPLSLNGRQETEGNERAARRAGETASGVSVERRV